MGPRERCGGRDGGGGRGPWVGGLEDDESSAKVWSSLFTFPKTLTSHRRTRQKVTCTRLRQSTDVFVFVFETSNFATLCLLPPPSRPGAGWDGMAPTHPPGSRNILPENAPSKAYAAFTPFDGKPHHHERPYYPTKAKTRRKKHHPTVKLRHSTSSTPSNRNSDTQPGKPPPHPTSNIHLGKGRENLTSILMPSNQ